MMFEMMFENSIFVTKSSSAHNDVLWDGDAREMAELVAENLPHTVEYLETMFDHLNRTGGVLDLGRDAEGWSWTAKPAVMVTFESVTADGWDTSVQVPVGEGLHMFAASTRDSVLTVRRDFKRDRSLETTVDGVKYTLREVY